MCFAANTPVREEKSTQKKTRIVGLSVTSKSSWARMDPEKTVVRGKFRTDAPSAASPHSYGRVSVAGSSADLLGAIPEIVYGRCVGSCLKPIGLRPAL